MFVSKTSSRHLPGMSSRRLQDVFSATIFRFPRRFQDAFARHQTLNINLLLMLKLMCFSAPFNMAFILELTLREKCPNTKFFLVRIFPHSD